MCAVVLGTFATFAAETAPPSLSAGLALLEHRDYAAARDVFQQLSAAEPSNAEVAFHLGLAQLRLKQPEAAVKSLERATALDPTQARYFRTLGDAYGENALRGSLLSKFSLARKCLVAYDRGVAAEPDNLDVRAARFHYYRGAPAIAGGGPAKAAAELDEIRRRDPIFAATLLSDRLVIEKKTIEAFAQLERLAAEHPEQKFHLYLIGRLAATTGQQLDRGAAALTDYLGTTPAGKEPSLAAAHWRRGQIHAQQHDVTAARADFDAALALAPDFAAVQDELARLPASPP